VRQTADFGTLRDCDGDLDWAENGPIIGDAGSNGMNRVA
jgi:hypothetical protein